MDASEVGRSRKLAAWASAGRENCSLQCLLLLRRLVFPGYRRLTVKKSLKSNNQSNRNPMVR